MRFLDDEDEFGRVPFRRIPPRFVIPIDEHVSILAEHDPLQPYASLEPPAAPPARDGGEAEGKEEEKGKEEEEKGKEEEQKEEEQKEEEQKEEGQEQEQEVNGEPPSKRQRSD